MSSMPVPALQHVLLEGKRTARATLPLVRTARVGHRADADAPPTSSLGAELAVRALASASIDPGMYRTRPLLRRIPACLRALGTSSEEQAHRLVESRSDARARAVGALLISVTSFFRDPAVFQDIERVVMPALVGATGPLRVWSAGCATGAELYSAAMLLAEAGLLDRSALLGTDCRADTIAHVVAAAFDEGAMHGVSDARLARFFEPAATGTRRPVEELRARAAWKTADITRQIEPGPWNMVLWRNVAIYLRAEPTRTVARGLASQLAPGGFLVVGKAERLPGDVGVRRVAPSIYQRSECVHDT